MNGLTTIAALCRSPGAGSELKGETNNRAALTTGTMKPQERPPEEALWPFTGLRNPRPGVEEA